MIQYDEDRLAYIEKTYAVAVDNFPEQAAPAKELVIKYLERYAPDLLPVYVGEAADKDLIGCDLDIAHYFICGLLRQRDEGNPDMTDERIDTLARKYLDLPYNTSDTVG